MAKTPEPLTEWTPEVEAHWKDFRWWATGTVKEHLDMDALFDRHINQDFQLNTWTEPVMNQEAFYVASAGGLLRRTVRGYDYSEENYFLCDPVKGTETKVKPERIWDKPEDALIYKLREFSKDMIRRTASGNESADSSRQRFRRMLRFLLQQLESL